MRASELLLCWELLLGTYSVGFNYVYFSSRLCCPLRFQGSPQTHQWECFLVFGNFLFFLRLPSRDGSPSLPLCLSFCFIFFPTSFQRQWADFWVPDVLCRHSEVVLWNLLSVQMFFWWICEGESGLPVLFLHHLRTASGCFPWGERGNTKIS